MVGKALTSADRFFMEAVDSVPDAAGQRVDLTTLASEEGFGEAEASARAWEAAGYGRHERETGAGRLFFAFSEAGYAKARNQADRMHQSVVRRWHMPTIDGASGWLAGGVFVVALLYSLMMFFWG
ncbi:hypothetical protein [Sphingomonas sp. OTU376]|uniref:hypothetical protein n=1 Tax=Sphingomonas sp. OTU376 TaxID=3043863 RepID=UPI00313DCA9F